MKFNKSSQLLLVSAASLLAASLLTACETLTVDFVFVTSSRAAGTNNYGEVDVFEINSESGFMRQIPTSPFPSGGRDPVAEAVSSDDNNLFVANQDDNTIVQFVIGNDGKLYPFNTVNTPGVFPLAVAVNGMNLFVLDTYQPLPTCSPAEPCSGSIAVYPLVPGGSASSDPCAATVCLQPPLVNASITANDWPIALPNSNDVLEPTGISVVPSGDYVYVAAYDGTAVPHAGYIFGFWVVPTTAAAAPSSATCPPIPSGSTTLPAGTLCPLNGGAPVSGGPFAITASGCQSAYQPAPYVLGTCPYGITSDPSSSYLYVTDVAHASVLGFSIGSTGLLTALANSPYPAGNQPIAVAADPSYPYIYVANSLDDTISAYSMSAGVLTSIGTYPTGLEPVAIGIDPSTNHFLYTANYLGNSIISGSISGFELSPTAGTLINSQNSPYTANAQTTALAAIPHNGTGGGLSK
ncbi:MAG: beta-propeller fold lactonase family protein [Terracidiphilus sp.]